MREQGDWLPGCGNSYLPIELIKNIQTPISAERIIAFSINKIIVEYYANVWMYRSHWRGWAVKASGLAGGKGVVVSNCPTEAQAAVDDLTAAFGEAAQTILVEEQLHGTEISVS